MYILPFFFVASGGNPLQIWSTFVVHYKGFPQLGRLQWRKVSHWYNTFYLNFVASSLFGLCAWCLSCRLHCWLVPTLISMCARNHRYYIYIHIYIYICYPSPNNIKRQFFGSNIKTMKQLLNDGYTTYCDPLLNVLC